MVLRKWMKISFVLVLFISWILPTTSWASEADESGTFTMKVSSQMPNYGDTIEVLISGHQLIDVYAFEINLEYDPTRLKFIDAKSDAPGFSVPPIVKDTHIQIAHTKVGKGKGLEGEQSLFKLHFQAIQIGNNELTLSSVKIVDSKLGNITKQINTRSTLTIHHPYAFDDLDSFDWAVAAIEDLASQGIVNGTGERQFSPASAVTRADFLVLLMRALGLMGTVGQLFDDIETDAYYAQPVAIARELGIVQGDEMNQFHPKASITREDMMVLTDRALRISNHLIQTGDQSDLTIFEDVSLLSDYAFTSVATLVKIGLVHGYDNQVFPKETTNRAQAAVLIYNLLTYIK
ncbi:S-layer homology domain-containing protein [Paenibacillus sp. LjRoot56]|uniref:S-layer homology domain-containing protein n=1 Tax=Paenibacillus sp. LjRoot56 TaxID=3342333 RepID=UPI003ECE971E